MKGLIIFHCWNSMNHAVETQAFDNMKSILKQNQNIPMLASVVERPDLLAKMPNALISDVDVMAEKNILVLKDWIARNQLKEVHIMGMHYNLCVRQLLTRLWEINKTSWENDFKARVIEQCTAACVDDEIFSMEQYKKNNQCDLLINRKEWTTNLK